MMTCFIRAQMLQDRPHPHFVVCCMQGPQIVTVPKFDVPNRYWIVPFLDAYLNYYGAIGSDFNSTPGQYLVVGRSKGQACTPQAHCSLCHELLDTIYRSLVLRLRIYLSVHSFSTCTHFTLQGLLQLHACLYGAKCSFLLSVSFVSLSVLCVFTPPNTACMTAVHTATCTEMSVLVL